MFKGPKVKFRLNFFIYVHLSCSVEKRKTESKVEFGI